MNTHRQTDRQTDRQFYFYGLANNIYVDIPNPEVIIVNLVPKSTIIFL